MIVMFKSVCPNSRALRKVCFTLILLSLAVKPVKCHLTWEENFGLQVMTGQSGVANNGSGFQTMTVNAKT